MSEYDFVYQDNHDTERKPQPQVMQWQPIDTAPKDGTWFLAYMSQYDIVSACWYCRVLCREYPREINPTHWMPLPHPPVTPS